MNAATENFLDTPCIRRATHDSNGFPLPRTTTDAARVYDLMALVAPYTNDDE